MKRTRLLITLGAGAVVALASAAYAGLKQTQLVDIEHLPGSYLRATGALGSVRNKGNGTDYIWCRIEAGATSTTGNMITCSAATATEAVNCCAMDTNGTLTAAIAAMNGDSVVTFEVRVPPSTGPDAGTESGGD